MHPMTTPKSIAFVPTPRADPVSEVAGGSLSHRRPFSDIPCRVADTVDGIPRPAADCRSPSSPKRRGARLARFTRSAAHRFRIRESVAGCPGMSDVVSCVRESYFSDVPRSRPALVVARGSVPVSPTGRFVVRVNEDNDCQLARHVVGSPFGTSAQRCRRHVGPTSAAHI